MSLSIVPRESADPVAHNVAAILSIAEASAFPQKNLEFFLSCFFLKEMSYVSVRGNLRRRTRLCSCSGLV